MQCHTYNTYLFQDVHATHKDLAIPLVMFHQGDVFVTKMQVEIIVIHVPLAIMISPTAKVLYQQFKLDHIQILSSDLENPFKDCGCDVTGAVDKNCDAEGKCMCKEGYTGDKCNQCAAGNFGFPNCHGKFDKDTKDNTYYVVRIT